MSFTASIPLVPDTIPSFASDIEVPSWTIDRTPTPINLAFELLNRERNYNILIRRHNNNNNNNQFIINYDFIPFNQKPLINLEKHTETITEFECTICYENISDNCAKLNCNHIFCNNCIKTQIQKNNICCALCREKITNITSDNITELKKII